MEKIEITKLPEDIIKDLRKETRDPKCDYVLEQQGKLYRICHLNPRGAFQYRVIYFWFKNLESKNYINYFATSTPLFLKDYLFLLILFIFGTVTVVRKYNDPVAILYNTLLLLPILLIIPVIIFFISLLVNIFSNEENTIKIGNLLSKNIKN